MARIADIVSEAAKRRTVHGCCRELIAWLRARGYDPLRLDEESARYTADAPAAPRAELPLHAPELVIVLGGDGTLLSVGRIFATTGTPLLSVNLGTLGFLTEVRLSELYATLEGWCQKCHMIEHRAMLRTELWRGAQKHSEYDALNDIVVTKGEIARMGDFAVELDGKTVAQLSRRRRDPSPPPPVRLAYNLATPTALS